MLISRRTALLSITSSTCWPLLARGAKANNECWSEGDFCRANIRVDDFDYHEGQEGFFWCWAATLSMIFRWHGKVVDQRSIVQQTFGAQVDYALDPLLLMRSVRRAYVDGNGNSFSVTSRIYSADFGLGEITNCDIISELANERPLVICNLSHMMVLIGVDYRPESHCTMPNIVSAWVADPHPYAEFSRDMGRGFRDLRNTEMLPVHQGGELRFMATVQVS
jgi:hypothetical protein